MDDPPPVRGMNQLRRLTPLERLELLAPLLAVKVGNHATAGYPEEGGYHDHSD